MRIRAISYVRDVKIKRWTIRLTPISQAAQEREERFFLLRRQAEAERMPLYRLIAGTRWPPATGHVSRLKTLWVEEFFQARDGPIVQQERPIPDASQ